MRCHGLTAQGVRRACRRERSGRSFGVEVGSWTGCDERSMAVVMDRFPWQLRVLGQRIIVIRGWKARSHLIGGGSSHLPEMGTDGLREALSGMRRWSGAL